jgi:hypothetical protein
VRDLSSEVRPTTDLHLLDSERMTGNTKVGLKSPGLSANRRLRWFCRTSQAARDSLMIG